MTPAQLTSLMAAILASGREPGSISLEAAVLIVRDAEQLQKVALLANAHANDPCCVRDPLDSPTATLFVPDPRD